MPSLMSYLQQKNNTKSDFEELAEVFYNDVKEDEEEESTDLKAHVKACTRRFKLLTLIDLHSLGEIRKLKKWLIIGALAIVFGKPFLLASFAALKGSSFLDIIQLFLSL